jgi:hypothetical protein
MRGNCNGDRRRKEEIPGNAHSDHSDDIDAENENDVSPARHRPGNEASPKALELLASLAADLAMGSHEITSAFVLSCRALRFH